MHLLSMRLGFWALILHPLPPPLHIYTLLILLQKACAHTYTHAHSHIYFVNTFIIHSCVFPDFSCGKWMTRKEKENSKKCSTLKKVISMYHMYHSGYIFCCCKCSVLNAPNCKERHLCNQEKYITIQTGLQKCGDLHTTSYNIYLANKKWDITSIIEFLLHLQ